MISDDICLSSEFVALQKVARCVPVTTGRDASIAIFIDLKGALQLCRAQHSGSLTTSEIWEVYRSYGDLIMS